jgi:hypothetical protein
MKVIGFNYNKIKVERLNDRIEKLKIGSNIKILEIKEIEKKSFKSKEDILSVKFDYIIDYEPKIAKVEVGGTIIFTMESKKIKEIKKQWKSKKLPDDFKLMLFNLILKKGNLKAIELEDEINLPIHIQLPSLQPKKE